MKKGINKLNEVDKKFINVIFNERFFREDSLHESKRNISTVLNFNA